MTRYSKSLPFHIEDHDSEIVLQIADWTSAHLEFWETLPLWDAFYTQSCYGPVASQLSLIGYKVFLRLFLVSTTSLVFFVVLILVLLRYVAAILAFLELGLYVCNKMERKRRKESLFLVWSCILLVVITLITTSSSLSFFHSVLFTLLQITTTVVPICSKVQNEWYWW